MGVVAKFVGRPERDPLVQSFLDAANTIILDKEKSIELALCCVLAKGHLLIEDVPGVGKTTLVKTFSKLMGLESQRIQFTNDLLPSDILGGSVYDKNTSSFVFHKGPIFTQLLFADELNRATPKTQSAFLQAMEESKISIEGKSFELPNPFLVIATQNPRYNIGTFPLPESQLDRFLMRISIGFPSREAEKKLLLGEKRSQLLEDLEPTMTSKDVLNLQAHAEKIRMTAPLVEYIQDIVNKTRQADLKGLSPRGSLCLVAAARAWALIQGRDFVTPEDVQMVAVPVINHRINPENEELGQQAVHLAQEILESVPVRE